MVIPTVEKQKSGENLAQPQGLQYSAGGHVLNFAPDKVYPLYRKTLSLGTKIYWFLVLFA